MVGEEDARPGRHRCAEAKFGGDGESAAVTINPKDGYWYLSGTSANRTTTILRTSSPTE